MRDDLISRKEAIITIENMIFESGRNLSKVYLLQDVKERIGQLNTTFDKEKVIEELEDYLFEKYCVEGDEKIAKIVEKGGIG